MFQIAQRGSTVGREVLGGVTTFMAMSYIIFVQRGLLGGVAGMDADGVVMATCLASAAACVAMGLLANYPIALAPGMGENFFFALTLAPVMAAWGIGQGWQMALGMTVLAGGLFVLLSLVQFRARILKAIPASLKCGIAAGIGLLIARVGLDWSRLADALSPGRFGGFADNPEALLCLLGLAVTVALLAFGVRGAILIGILAATAVALAAGWTQWRFPLAWPRGLGNTAGAFAQGTVDIFRAVPSHALEVAALCFVLVFMDLFDTVGTLVCVAGPAGLMKGDELPGAERALLADAAGTVVGGMLGTSTVTSYVESVTGVQSGARTGLAAIVAGGLLAVGVFFQPLAETVTGDFVSGGQQRFPTLAAALILVGAMMLRTLRQIDWEDVTEYVPAFLAVIVMPLTLSISAGIAAGFAAYAAGKLLSGRWRECSVLVYVLALLFVGQYVLMALIPPGG